MRLSGILLLIQINLSDKKEGNKMEFDAKEFNNTQAKLKEMIEINKKNSKNGVWKWNEIALAAMFIEDAVKNNGDSAAKVEGKAYWMAIRLKFTTPEIDNLIIGYLNGERNYTYELYGRTIYSWMKGFGHLYPEAILNAYIENITKEERQNLGYYYPIPFRLGKLRNTKLLEDGKTIVPCERVNPLSLLSKEELDAMEVEAQRGAEEHYKKMAEKKGMSLKEYKKLIFGDDYEE